MILVDTNIIIDFWKKPNEVSRAIFETEKVYICGIVKAELLHGAKDELSYIKIANGLKFFPEVKINDTFWDELSRNLYLLKNKGITVPFQNAMIATIAIANSLELWTNDKHFDLIKEVLKPLLLYKIISD